MGRMYLPHGEADVSGYPLVIFCHGLGSNYRELEHYGPFFAERGIACFLFDFLRRRGGEPQRRRFFRDVRADRDR